MSNTNMFALLNDSDSDDDQPKSKAPAKAPAPKPKPDRKPREDKPQRDNNNRGPRADPVDRGPYDGSDKVRNPAEDRAGKGERRSGKGKGGRKGGESRGDSGREYPRRSGTGRGRENNRSGGGKYNWGKDGEQPPAEEGEAQAEGAEQADPEATEPVEEEPDNMGLDEYLALQSQTADLSLNKCDERKVEVDSSAQEIQHEEVEEDYACMFHSNTKAKKKHAKKQARAGYKQADTVLQMKFVDEGESSKGKGGKGDRRSGGKGRGKGYNQSNGGNKPAMDMGAAAFPELC